MKRVEKRQAARDRAKQSRKKRDKLVLAAVREIQKEGPKRRKGETDRAWAARKHGFAAAVRQQGRALAKARRAAAPHHAARRAAAGERGKKLGAAIAKKPRNMEVDKEPSKRKTRSGTKTEGKGK